MGPILTTADIASRWSCSETNVTARWRSGRMPAPFNADQARGFRWHADTIEAFERGQWRPAGAPVLVAVGTGGAA